MLYINILTQCVADVDLPSRDRLEKYDICVSRVGVFADNPAQKHIYKLDGNSVDESWMDYTRSNGTCFKLNATRDRSRRKSRKSPG